MTDDRFSRGMAKIQADFGERGERVLDAFADIAPDLSRYVAEFAYADVHSRPGLDTPQRSLVTISVLTGIGGCEPQLAVHVHAGLNVGLKPTEIVEAVMQCAVYAGFPRALQAMTVVRAVFDERGLLPL